MCLDLGPYNKNALSFINISYTSAFSPGPKSPDIKVALSAAEQSTTTSDLYVIPFTAYVPASTLQRAPALDQTSATPITVINDSKYSGVASL